MQDHARSIIDPHRFAVAPAVNLKGGDARAHPLPRRVEQPASALLPIIIPTLQAEGVGRVNDDGWLRRDSLHVIVRDSGDRPAGRRETSRR